MYLYWGICTIEFQSSPNAITERQSKMNKLTVARLEITLDEGVSFAWLYYESVVVCALCSSYSNYLIHMEWLDDGVSWRKRSRTAEIRKMSVTLYRMLNFNMDNKPLEIWRANLHYKWIHQTASCYIINLSACSLFFGKLFH